MGDHPSPQIDIGVEHKDNQTVFFVCDNGIGIEPKYYSKLFNLFEKLNPKMDGTGMGLAIAKRIVELYQGKIWVESKGLGEGCCFRFTLPGALKIKRKEYEHERWTYHYPGGRGWPGPCWDNPA